MTKLIEQGDIYFFYRPKVNEEQIDSAEDVQRLYLVLVPDQPKGALARLFLVGKKRLPEIMHGGLESTAKEWMMNTLTDTPEAVGEELRPLSYMTKTRGEQQQGEAIPAGEGRYALMQRNASTRLGYRLYNPKTPGEAQRELGILKEASLIISVRNPALDVPGFPEARPDYPAALRERFAEERWIDVDDPELLNYEDAQFLLIGAHDSLEQAGIEISGKPAVFETLDLDAEQWPTNALEEGEFTEPGLAGEPRAPRGDRSKGGERGGRRAARTASAAGIAKALKGIDFPCTREEVVDYARDHNADTEIIEALSHLREERFETMPQVEKAFAEVQ